MAKLFQKITRRRKIYAKRLSRFKIGRHGAMSTPGVGIFRVPYSGQLGTALVANLHPLLLKWKSLAEWNLKLFFISIHAQAVKWPYY